MSLGDVSLLVTCNSRNFSEVLFWSVLHEPGTWEGCGVAKCLLHVSLGFELVFPIFFVDKTLEKLYFCRKLQNSDIFSNIAECQLILSNNDYVAIFDLQGPLHSCLDSWLLLLKPFPRCACFRKSFPQKLFTGLESSSVRFETIALWTFWWPAG